MLALPCDYASVDVLDLLGTNKVNMTKNIVKVCIAAARVQVTRVFSVRAFAAYVARGWDLLTVTGGLLV